MSPESPQPSRKPEIVAPVSRQLSVAEIDRSIGFYRDVLGFEVRDVSAEDAEPRIVEAVYGPARIVFGTQEGALDSTLQLRPRGAAIMFFETDDVGGMREALRVRGGKVSELEKVHFIKMRVFEIRDPDGHTLWFGQSFAEPDKPRPRSLLEHIMPNFPLDDVPAGIKFYQEMLGFKINYAQDDFGVMFRDDVTLILFARNEKHSGIGSCYVYVRDADALYEEYKSKGVNVSGEPVSHPWGLRDFHVLDLEGNQITFGQPFE